MTAPIHVGDEPIAPEAVVAYAAVDAVPVELTRAARERIAATRRAADAVAARRPVYGRTTGVGANRLEDASADPSGHALRLLRSHAGDVGAELPDDVVRATLLIRLAQLAGGGGGLRPEIADALAAALSDGWLPRLRDGGGIGTGDLTVLAQLGLALAGEDGGWHRFGEDASSDRPPRPGIDAGDALPLMSSNAASLAVATLAWGALRDLLAASLAVAALSFHALAGNPEAFAEPVVRGRPLPGLAGVAAVLRRLCEGGAEPARLQDPFALRCLPPVAGALADALDTLRRVLAVEINASAENPLIADEAAFHHGGFHAAPVAVPLDAVRLALVPVGALVSARIAAMFEPALSGLPPFLAVGEPGSSGLLIAEYAAADSLAQLRAEAVPTVTGAAVLSRGMEEHAGFAWQGARQATEAVRHVKTLVALEWVVAERAVRMKDARTPPALEPARALAEAFDDRRQDHVMGADVRRAEAALPGLARAVRALDVA